jgi:two-component system, cell cycle sensor histidine kinase and response regulator CckA
MRDLMAAAPDSTVSGGADLRYRDIVENAYDLILTVDLDDRLTSVNAAFERALGYAREEVLGRPLFSVVAPAWRAQLDNATAAKLRRSGEPTVYDLEFLAKDGRAVPVEVASWLVVEDGTPVAMQAICRDVSERNAAACALRRAEAALSEQEDLLRRAFEDTVVGMLVTAPDGRIERANTAFSDLVGYAPSELRALAVVDITHPDDRAETEAAQAGLASGELQRFNTEKRFLRRTGEPVDVEVGISPVRDAHGEVTSLVLQALDITARRDAEAAMRESEKLFRVAFDDAATGMLIVSPYGRIIRANSALAELLGYGFDELETLDLLDLSHPADRADTRARLAGLRTGELTGLVFEKRYLRNDGLPVWVQVAASPVRDSDGRLMYVVTQVVDLTARRESEERFRLLFEASPQGIAVFDENACLLQTNPALAEILGYDANELAGLTAVDFTHPDDLAMDLVEYTELLEGKRSHYEVEKRFLRKDGGIVWGHVTVFALPQQGDAPRLAIGILADVTERRALEDQLRQSQRMEAIGQLAGGVAHDFNNLLTAVKSYCDIASDALAHDGDPTVRASVDGIRTAADRAAEVTHQLLAFSRRQVLELRSIDLNAAVTDQGRFLRRLLGDDIEVRISLAPGLPPVTMDAGQLTQVVMNLAVNARDAMPAGGILTIETQRVDLDRAPTTTGLVSGPHVLLAVSDTGCGMDATTIRCAFEPFFTTKEPGKGTGLGLSTVLGIVEQSGGRVSVYSEPGIGTTFKVYMPSGGVARQVRSAPAFAPETERPTGTAHILLVEDNEAVRVPVTRLLSELGYDVVSADGPVQALQLATGAAIDVLVTDVVMPAMNGRQLAELLLSGRPGLKVLYISGYTDDAVIARGMIEPGTAFLQKPFGADLLAQKISELLDS